MKRVTWNNRLISPFQCVFSSVRGKHRVSFSTFNFHVLLTWRWLNSTFLLLLRLFYFLSRWIYLLCFVVQTYCTFRAMYFLVNLTRMNRQYSQFCATILLHTYTHINILYPSLFVRVLAKWFYLYSSSCRIIPKDSCFRVHLLFVSFFFLTHESVIATTLNSMTSHWKCLFFFFFFFDERKIK